MHCSKLLSIKSNPGSCQIRDDGSVWGNRAACVGAQGKLSTNILAFSQNAVNYLICIIGAVNPGQ